MPETSLKDYDWKALSDEVPSEMDFDPCGGDLDAQSAWREFGGLSLSKAYEHFVECPENRQEDFMFMGSMAFIFYFPVVERYLYSVRAFYDLDDCQVWILGHVLISQLANPSPDKVACLRERVMKLTKYVRSHLGQYAIKQEEQARIDAPWMELDELLDRGSG